MHTEPILPEFGAILLFPVQKIVRYVLLFLKIRYVVLNQQMTELLKKRSAHF